MKIFKHAWSYNTFLIHAGRIKDPHSRENGFTTFSPTNLYYLQVVRPH